MIDHAGNMSSVDFGNTSLFRNLKRKQKIQWIKSKMSAAEFIMAKFIGGSQI